MADLTATNPIRSYWWECTECHKQLSFEDAVGKGPVVFFWDELSTDWNQKKLLMKCAFCERETVRITFDFPRDERERLSIVSIVGLTPAETNEYLPMLWETFPASNPNDRWLHFNYMNGRNNWGLNKPAVFSIDGLNRLLDLFRERTGRELRVVCSTKQ